MSKFQNERALVICPNCKKVLEKPTLLKCTHTFCRKCLHGLITENEESKEKQIECPICQMVTKIPDGDLNKLKLNHVKQSMIQKITDSASGGKFKCNECTKNKTATKICKQCNTVFCSECADFHLTRRVSANHKLDDIDKVKAEDLHNVVIDYCDKHTDQLLEYYCKTCKVQACCKCEKSRNHKEHYVDVCLTEELRDEKKEEIKKVLAEGKEGNVVLKKYNKKAKDKLSEAEKERKKALKVIEDNFEQIRVALEERKEELMGKVNARYDESKKSVELGEKKSKVLEDWVEYGEELLQSSAGGNLEALDAAIEQLNACYTDIDLPKIKENGYKIGPIEMGTWYDNYNNSIITKERIQFNDQGQAFYVNGAGSKAFQFYNKNKTMWFDSTRNSDRLFTSYYYNVRKQQVNGNISFDAQKRAFYYDSTLGKNVYQFYDNAGNEIEYPMQSRNGKYCDDFEQTKMLSFYGDRLLSPVSLGGIGIDVQKVEVVLNQAELDKIIQSLKPL